MEALKKRPEAAEALRAAMRGADLETRRRAEEILEYYDRRVVRDLKAAGKEGRVDRFIELLAAWPTGKYEADAGYALQDLAKKLADLHAKQGGVPLALPILADQSFPAVIADRLTEDSALKLNRNVDPSYKYYLRAGEVDYDLMRRGKAPRTVTDLLVLQNAAIVAARSVRLIRACERCVVIFAGGSVELNDLGDNYLVVSGGDVTLNRPVGLSLIIARGKVTAPGCQGNHIIAGKSVTFTTERTPEIKNLIRENDPNPLGFIRWTDPPKAKTPGKAK
jgi:hypothetical protein